MKNFTKKLIFIVIIIAAITGIVVSIRVNEIIYNNKIIKKSKEISFETKEKREEGINILRGLIEEGKHFKIKYKIGLINKLSKLYFMNSDYKNGLEYSMQSVYFSKRAGDTFNEAKSLINIANVFMQLGKYEIAEEYIKYALNLNIKEEEEHNIVKMYGYTSLADNYSKSFKNKEAIKYVNRVRKYLKQTYPISETHVIKMDIIEARAQLNDCNIERCKEILKTIKNRIDNYKTKISMDIYIPYLMINAKVYIYEGNLKEGLKIACEAFDLCHKEGIKDIKHTYMDYILEVIQINEEFIKNGEKEEYEYEILREYKKTIDEKNDIFVKFVIDNCKVKLDLVEARENKIKIMVSIGVILIMAMMFTTLWNCSRKYKIQIELDPLLGIYNRRKFEEDYKKAISNQMDFGIIVIDIDHFKYLNDNYGHAFGDLVLKKISYIIKGKLYRNDELFRYGGEEFCILYYNKKLDMAVDYAELIRKEIENTIWEKKIKVTASLGVAHISQSENIFELADKNLYKSKENGRNRVSYTKQD